MTSKSLIFLGSYLKPRPFAQSAVLPIWPLNPCLLGVNLLATSEIMTGRLPIRDVAHTRYIYSVAPVGDLTTGTSHFMLTFS